MILGIFSQFSAAQREKLVTQLAKKSQSLGDKFSWLGDIYDLYYPVVVLKDTLVMETMPLTC